MFLAICPVAGASPVSLRQALKLQPGLVALRTQPTRRDQRLKHRVETVAPSLPSLRFKVREAAQILRMSRAQLYNRIHDGSLKPQKDGARTYITRAELERYVQSCSA